MCDGKPNDECRMPNDERNPNDEIRKADRMNASTRSTTQTAYSGGSKFGLRHSFVIRHSSFVILSALLFLTLTAHSAPPLQALLITGGCCHDYQAQKKILTEGISARANVTWTILHEGDSNGKEHEFSIYQKPDWTKGFDVIVHNECSGQVTNAAFVEHIAKGHADGV